MTKLGVLGIRYRALATIKLVSGFLLDVCNMWL